MGNIVYKINLNKASNRLDQYELKQKKRRTAAIVFFFIALIGITAVSVVFSQQTRLKINSLQSEITAIDDEIAQLSASSQYLSPEDIFALSQLATTRMTWTEKLNVLGNILPRDVVITELYYDYQINSLKIKGISRVNPEMKDLDRVVSIVNLIKGNKDFSKDFVDIKFSSSTRIKHQDQEIIQFEIECLVG
jgi:Tfp pilus assembly protein PilN